jgi:sRNA-binding carbon storage regulator CsrA
MSAKRSYGSDIGGLILNRKVGEELVIGEGANEAVIIVETASGGRTQLRILAGPSVIIKRAEIMEGNE